VLVRARRHGGRRPSSPIDARHAGLPGTPRYAHTLVPHVVTISATYGAGGTTVSRAVADALHLPYLERVVTPHLARQLQPAGPESLAEDEKHERLFQRIVEALAGLPLALGGAAPTPVEEVSTEERVRADVEASIRNLADTTGGVVLGRAGMAVLADRPDACHVRLDGPKPRRIRQAMAREHVDEAEATRRLRETDKARALYVRRFYDRDPRDSTLYHLVLDSTTLPLDVCAQLIVRAATALWEAAPG
jgi:cytidylate kinase